MLRGTVTPGCPIIKSLSHCPLPIGYTRVLSHLLCLASPGNGQGQAQPEVTLTADKGYDQSLLFTGPLTVKRSSRPMPTPAERPSRPLFEDACQYSMAIMAQSTLDCRTARAAVRPHANSTESSDVSECKAS